MDEVKPSDLSLNFLREFMELPVSYYSPGAPIKYRKWYKNLSQLLTERGNNMKFS